MKTNKELYVLKIRVAIEVFGWKETDKRLPDHDPNWISYEAPWYETPDGEIEHYTNIPDYPRKIADAWLVVEKIRKDDPFGIGPKFAEEIAIMFDANQDDHYADVYNVLMNLNAEAICLAALEAVGE